MAAALVTSLIAGGCVTSSVEQIGPDEVLLPNERGAREGRTAGLRRTDEAPVPSPIPGFEGAGTPVQVFVSAMRAELQPRGTIPYDQQTLPVVSPDGQFIATQVGLAPSWDLLIARDGADPGIVGGVQIFRLMTDDASPPVPVARAAEPVLLGRSADRFGFLVESPRPDGSRWIGRCDWESGAIEWLVTGPPGEVNAFGTFGPDGRLAWCRRSRGETGFALVMRDPPTTDGSPPSETVLPSGIGEWVAPLFDDTGTGGLFALFVRTDGGLDLVHLDATADVPAATMRRTALALAMATRGTAIQALGTATNSPDGPRVAQPQFCLSHPSYSPSRAAVWRPTAPDPTLVDFDAFVCTIDPSDPAYCLQSSGNYLIRRSIDEPRDRVRVIAGLHLVRSTTDPNRPFLLFQPAGSAFGLTVLKFVPVDPTAPVGADTSG